MSAPTQALQPAAIQTPLGEDILLLKKWAVRDSVSEPFEIRCEVLAEQYQGGLKGLVREPITIRVNTDFGTASPDPPIFFNGYVREVRQLHPDERFYCYSIVAVPKVWFLGLQNDCRIFQEMTVPEIVSEILKENQIDFKLDLHATYEKRTYCVQYRESCLNFISRLLEEEGIHYYFAHGNGHHQMVIADFSPGAKPLANAETLEFNWEQPSEGPDDKVVYTFDRRSQAHIESVVLRDFDFRWPSTDLSSEETERMVSPTFDYPGKYDTRDLGSRRARVRLEEEETYAEVVEGKSTVYQLSPGYRAALTRHPYGDLNAEYFVVSVRHTGAEINYRSSSESDDGYHYSNEFMAIPRKVHYRPPLRAEKPFVKGSQTAIVVGPPGEEIYTDNFGRIKVQFHWDRRGPWNAGSSCWIRVSQFWAGREWGSISIPRIGQEVVVDFLEGDPDRPVVAGRLYNAEQMPPYPLPAGANNMGFKSKSVHGGGFNEISINDTNATEGINIHAQYNMTSVVEHDESVTIHNCRTKTIDVDETVKVGNNRTESVGVDEKVSIGSNRTTDVGSNDTKSIGGNKSCTVSQNEIHTVSLTRTQSTGINEMINVGAAQELTVGGIRLVTVGVSQMVNVGMKHSLNAGNEIKLSSKKILLEASQEITLKCGGGSISINSAGIITIKGPLVKINC